MNKKAEGLMPWIVGIIVFLIAIPITWTVVNSATRTLSGTNAAESAVVTNITYTDFAINPTDENNAACVVKSVKKGATYLTTANYTLDSSENNCAIKGKKVATNGTWTLNYTYTYNDDGYIEDPMSRTIVLFFVAMVALGALAFVALKIKS